MVDQRPYENVRGDHRSFWLPRRKWREILFVGAVAPCGEYFMRVPSRPLPPFRDPDFFPEGVLLRARLEGDDWVHIERVEAPDA